jgi:osmotically-inducible protein OsmY
MVRSIRYNGHVRLYVTIDNEQVRELVTTRAQTVPGVFDVKVFIQIANHGQNENQRIQPPQQ